MNLAARALIGTHDVAAFAGGWERSPGESNRDGTDDAGGRVDNRATPGGDCRPALVFTIEGNGFLPHMVRNLVGSLVVIGMGDAPVDWLETLLRGRDRRLAAPTAPPHGLILWQVRYSRDDDEQDAARRTPTIEEK
jgi:tRNA pseudouridine38-40 synthase